MSQLSPMTIAYVILVHVKTQKIDDITLLTRVWTLLRFHHSFLQSASFFFCIVLWNFIICLDLCNRHHNTELLQNTDYGTVPSQIRKALMLTLKSHNCLLTLTSGNHLSVFNYYSFVISKTSINGVIQYATLKIDF